jgi:uncharacterized protein (DUF4415 family)
MAKQMQIGKSMKSTSKMPSKSSGTLLRHSSILKKTKSDGDALAKPKAASSLLSSRSGRPIAASFPQGVPLAESESGITRFSAAELFNRPPGRTDWARVNALTDEDIARAVADDPDAVPLDVDWSKAKIYYPKGKTPLSIRIDPDVLAFFKSAGRGYQTRINAVLRSYVEHEKTKT